MKGKENGEFTYYRPGGEIFMIENWANGELLSSTKDDSDNSLTQNQ